MTFKFKIYKRIPQSLWREGVGCASVLKRETTRFLAAGSRQFATIHYTVAFFLFEVKRNN